PRDLHSFPTRRSSDLVTSVNGVEGMFKRLTGGGRDARALAPARVAVVGPGTAAALAARGIVADIVPERAVAESLVEALADTPVRDRKSTRLNSSHSQI